MNYSFDISIAKEYGVNEAIMIENFRFWILKNKANESNFYDGRYWTFNSIRAFKELFPFFTEKTIRTTLNHLKEKGVLISGNYNKNPYDKTSWYAFKDEDKWLCQIGNIDLPFRANGCAQSGEPIPDINTDVNTNTKEEIKEEIENHPLKEALEKWLSYKKELKKMYKPIGLRECIKKLERFSGNNPDVAMRIVNESISNGWSGLFPLKDKQENFKDYDDDDDLTPAEWLAKYSKGGKNE